MAVTPDAPALPIRSTSGSLTVAVIVPVRNGGSAFDRCLDALARLEPAPAEKIVVVDGDDATSQRQAARFEDVRLISVPERGGPARARNIGVNESGGEILLFVDADVEIRSDCVGRVLATFEDDAELAAVFGSYDDDPGEKNFLSQYKNLFHHYTHQTSDADASTFWAGCGAIRRDVFLANEGFDESFVHPSIEDIDLGYRLRAAGYRIRLEKALLCRHWKRWTVTSLLGSDICHRALPWARLLRRRGAPDNNLNLGFTSRLSAATLGSLLLAAVAAGWHAALWWLVLGLTAILSGLNVRLYGFFLRKRGPLFVLCAIPWHWLYYFYCGGAFLWALLRPGAKSSLGAAQTPSRDLLARAPQDGER